MSAAAEAIELKNKGNDAFKAHNWPTAIEYYTKAIEKNDKEPSFYTNRAQVSRNKCGAQAQHCGAAHTRPHRTAPQAITCSWSGTDHGRANRPISRWSRTATPLPTPPKL